MEDAVRGGHVCLGLSLKTMNACLLFTSLCLRTVGDGDGHTLFNTSLVLITVPYRWLMRGILPAGRFFRGTPFAEMNNGTGGFIHEHNSISRNSHGIFPWLDIFLKYQVAVCCPVSFHWSTHRSSSPWVPSPGSWWPLHGWDPVADAGAAFRESDTNNNDIMMAMIVIILTCTP